MAYKVLNNVSAKILIQVYLPYRQICLILVINKNTKNELVFHGI